jgi:hypothetical protein
MKRQLLYFPSHSLSMFVMALLFALAFNCTAEDPVLTSSTPFVRASSSAAVYASINNCAISGGGGNGTNFTYNVVYEASGNFTISKMDGTYTWSDGTTGTTTFTFTDAPTTLGFRNAGRNGMLSVSDRCVRFGSTTFIDYAIKITTSSQLQTSVTLRVMKPAGAN